MNLELSYKNYIEVLKKESELAHELIKSQLTAVTLEQAVGAAIGTSFFKRALTKISWILRPLRGLRMTKKRNRANRDGSFLGKVPLYTGLVALPHE